MIFSQQEPSEETKSGQGEGAPEAALLRNRKLEVDAFVDLGAGESTVVAAQCLYVEARGCWVSKMMVRWVCGF